MTLGVSFSGAAQSFLGGLEQTRYDLAGAAFRLKCDAKHARSWGFFAIGWVGQKLLDRERDAVNAREGTMRGYAERAVWLTHFLDDPDEINAIKSGILRHNSHEITVDELDAFLVTNIKALPFHDASHEQRDNMINRILHSQGRHACVTVPNEP